MRLHQVKFVQQGTKLLQFVGISFTLGDQYKVNQSPFPLPNTNLIPQTQNQSRPQTDLHPT